MRPFLTRFILPLCRARVLRLPWTRRVVFSLLLLCAGCWTPGDIRDGLPAHRDKFPPDAAFHIPKTRDPRVEQALSDALVARGFTVAEDAESCDWIIQIEILGWEYNDAGFSGFRPRDDMTLSVKIVDRRRKRIESRATIEIRSDFRILARYVEAF